MTRALTSEGINHSALLRLYSSPRRVADALQSLSDNLDDDGQCMAEWNGVISIAREAGVDIEEVGAEMMRRGMEKYGMVMRLREMRKGSTEIKES